MCCSLQLSFGDWDYVFNLPGGHVVHCIIKPSVELNDMYGTSKSPQRFPMVVQIPWTNTTAL